jgi:6-pyruvoyltetrahydropterin/6-carboxytetrahydropterin synthase
MAYRSTKTYGHNIGLSACFRQPNATSHCKLLHGYSLAFKFTFEATELDDNNWVVDFGGLKRLKKWLEDNFDHKVVLDEMDPNLHHFHVLEDAGLCELNIVNGVGVEMFAKHAWTYANKLVSEMTDGRCRCIEVECSEHGANSAIYKHTE